MVKELTIDDVECEEIQHHGDVTMFCKLPKGHKPYHKFRFVKDGKDFTYPPWPVRKNSAPS